jgi:hypothetical protein
MFGGLPTLPNPRKPTKTGDLRFVSKYGTQELVDVTTLERALFAAVACTCGYDRAATGGERPKAVRNCTIPARTYPHGFANCKSAYEAGRCLRCNGGKCLGRLI